MQIPVQPQTWLLGSLLPSSYTYVLVTNCRGYSQLEKCSHKPCHCSHSHVRCGLALQPAAPAPFELWFQFSCRKFPLLYVCQSSPVFVPQFSNEIVGHLSLSSFFSLDWTIVSSLNICCDVQHPDALQDPFLTDIFRPLKQTPLSVGHCSHPGSFSTWSNTLQVIYSLRSATSCTNSPLWLRKQTSDNSHTFNMKETNPTAPPELLWAAELIN